MIVCVHFDQFSTLFKWLTVQPKQPNGDGAAASMQYGYVYDTIEARDLKTLCMQEIIGKQYIFIPFPSLIDF